MGDNQNQQAELAFAAFVDRISSRAGRKAFIDNPEAALTEWPDLPPEVFGFLKALSMEELTLLSSLSETNKKAGLSTSIGDMNATLAHL
jgi:hypothetical protein